MNYFESANKFFELFLEEKNLYNLLEALQYMGNEIYKNPCEENFRIHDFLEDLIYDLVYFKGIKEKYLPGEG